jgi:Uma2 family endonuclease
MGLPTQRRLTYAEYLAAEAVASEKHHFVDGEMFAMAGGTREHAAVQTRLLVALGNALKGRPCVPYSSELRVHLPHLQEGCYADGVVVCGRFERHPSDPDATINPTALFEVLSPSTEAYDRGRKFQKVRGLPSLGLYVLLAQDRPLVEVFERSAGGKWELSTFQAGDTVVLAPLGIAIAVDDVYAGVFDEGG